MDAARTDNTETEPSERVGHTLLDKWHLDALLGVGGMAAVYSATHRNGMRGAVKMLHPTCAADATVHSRFLREGTLANRVAHPGAVRVLDDDVTPDGCPFLVMELLDGSSLGELAERSGGVIDLESVLRFTDQVLDVLASAHDHGIVHRDIKPENVFVTREGDVKVLDFGIAGIDGPSPDESRTTQSGTPMGTPAFMAPEQAMGRWDVVGPQSDLWATGAMMFTLLSGQLVFHERTVAAILSTLISKPARSLAEVCPSVPPAVVEVVDGALRRSLAARWSDARTMQQALRDAYRAVYGRPMPTATAEEPPPASHVARRAPESAAPTVLTPLPVVPTRGSRGRRIAAMAALGAVLLTAAFVTAQAREPARDGQAAQVFVDTIASPTAATAPAAAMASAAFVPARAETRALESPAPAVTTPGPILGAAHTTAARDAPSPVRSAAGASSATSTQPAAPRRVPMDLKALFDRRH